MHTFYVIFQANIAMWCLLLVVPIFIWVLTESAVMTSYFVCLCWRLFGSSKGGHWLCVVERKKRTCDFLLLRYKLSVPKSAAKERPVLDHCYGCHSDTIILISVTPGHMLWTAAFRRHILKHTVKKQERWSLLLGFSSAIQSKWWETFRQQ